jgi:hypothetical protein
MQDFGFTVWYYGRGGEGPPLAPFWRRILSFARACPRAPNSRVKMVAGCRFRGAEIRKGIGVVEKFWSKGFRKMGLRISSFPTFEFFFVSCAAQHIKPLSYSGPWFDVYRMKLNAPDLYRTKLITPNLLPLQIRVDKSLWIEFRIRVD